MNVPHGNIVAVYQDIFLAIESARECEHDRYTLQLEHYGATCCNCGLTQSGGIHPGYFKVKWKKLLTNGEVIL